MRRLLVLFIVCGALLTLLTPVFGQDTGLIVEGNLRGEAGIGSLNPLMCDNPNCRRITSLLFPSLFRVDGSGLFAPGTETDGLADSWELDGETLTVHLRHDRVWSDGTPVTAYDVYFSYLAIDSEDISTTYYWQLENLVKAVAPVEDFTIAFVLNEPNCADISDLNFPVIPSHVYDPNFAESARFSGGDILEWSETTQPDRDFSNMGNHPSSSAPSITSGFFQLEERRYGEYVRLISPDGRRAFAYVDVPDRDTQVDRFLRSELNLLVDPPYERRHDLRAAEGVNMIELPGEEWFFIALNLADPQRPRSAFDEAGNPIDQGHHPIFSDPQVRRALQMAINVPALIDAAAEGDGALSASFESPASWAFNLDLTPIAYDPMEAARLLEAAGWKDTNRDGVRECISCLYAVHNAPLSFELLYTDYYSYSDTLGFAPISNSTIANLLSQQLYAVGVRMGVNPVGDSFGARDQRVDAYLASLPGSLLTSAAGEEFLTPTGDVIEDGQPIGLNTSSYNNPRVTELFAQAAAAPACNVDTRRAAYQEIQAILQQDQPFIYLFSPKRVIATRGDATALAPEIQEMLLR